MNERTEILKSIEDTIEEIVTGSIEDLKHSNDFPLDTRGLHYASIGDLRQIGDFETNETILRDIIGTAIGRSLRMIVLHINPSMMFDIEGMLDIISSTEPLEQRTLTKLLNQYRTNNPTPTINPEALQRVMGVREEMKRSIFGPPRNLH